MTTEQLYRHIRDIKSYPTDKSLDYRFNIVSAKGPVNDHYAVVINRFIDGGTYISWSPYITFKINISGLWSSARLDSKHPGNQELLSEIEDIVKQYIRDIKLEKLGI